MLAILAHHGPESRVATALGRDFKGKISSLSTGRGPDGVLIRWLACAIYVLVALIWFVPDRRIERVFGKG